MASRLAAKFAYSSFWRALRGCFARSRFQFVEWIKHVFRAFVDGTSTTYSRDRSISLKDFVDRAQTSDQSIKQIIVEFPGDVLNSSRLFYLIFSNDCQSPGWLVSLVIGNYLAWFGEHLLGSSYHPYITVISILPCFSSSLLIIGRGAKVQNMEETGIFMTLPPP